MSDITSRFGFGGANLNPGGTGKPTLAQALRDVADDLSVMNTGGAMIEESMAVSSDVGLLSNEPAMIIFVDVDAGTSQGPKIQRNSGATLAAGQFQWNDANHRELSFFGADAVTNAIVGYVPVVGQSAKVTAEVVETYDLDDGDTLLVSVNGGDVQTATFETADFANIDAATAAEVVAVLNADISDVSAEVVEGKPVMRTDAVGPQASIQVTGGTAAATLGFDALEHVGTGVLTRKV